MAKLDFTAFETHLKAFDFPRLFTDVLGWNRAATERDWQTSQALAAGQLAYSHRTVAELGDALKSLREEGRLIYAEDDAALREPRVVCSMGLIREE